MSEYDATIGFLPLAEAQKYFNMPAAVHALELLVDDPDTVGALRPPLQAAAGSQVFISDWRQRNGSFYNMIELQRSVLFLILTMIVLVAALNIISGLVMLVKDKGRDIAILRTMGATRAAVMRVFFMTGASIGIAGTLAGLALGVAVSLNIDSLRRFLSWATGTDLFPSTIYFLSYLPAEMAMRDVVSVVVMTLSMSMLATLYPAWRAARLDPVQALRYE
jgi:lipoprotein-releasing system permease protein